MPDILVGTTVKAADFPASVWSQDDTNINDITSTSFIPGSPVVAVTFTAPTSGRVLMFVGGGAMANTGDNRLFMAANVFLGTDATGTEVLSSSVGFTGCGWSLASTDFYFQTRMFHLPNLIPGATYYARVTYSVTTSGATDGRCDITCREIGVVPVS